MHESPTLESYREAMSQCIRLIYPNIHDVELNNALDYSINKRLYNANISIENSYTNKTQNTTLLKIADYINSKEPIMTSFGTLFRKHGDVPNPLFETVQSFLDLRTEHKNAMFKFPKGSENFEKYNLLQSLI